MAVPIAQQGRTGFCRYALLLTIAYQEKVLTQLPNELSLCSTSNASGHLLHQIAAPKRAPHCVINQYSKAYDIKDGPVNLSI